MPIGRNSNTWARERIVSGILSPEVVAMMKTTCGGGSSTDFSSALNDEDRELVDLIDDEHLVAVARGRDGEAADDDLAHVVDAGVGGGVDLEDVHVAAGRDLLARIADAARIRRGPLVAVQRPREQAGGRRLAHAPRPGEDERLVDAAARERVAERLGDGLLPDDLVELFGAPLAREDLVHGRPDVSTVKLKADAGPTATREGLRHMSVTT